MNGAGGMLWGSVSCGIDTQVFTQWPFVATPADSARAAVFATDFASNAGLDATAVTASVPAAITFNIDDNLPNRITSSR
ncbi:hypothetical protein HNP84_004206 [Thermocatellispora tengchongensis]|uniref:Uncharacterized protein n=1 Tax=Thermocatellispora tengchongensis TaxID=1073253 RepID=A0A840NZW6_9ACTN|nr:hypothetical protein [Thermocatellispora tengchongensis]MBB5134474.1 hypothetical protein [Thermocatellispora tengchongensis]